ncbi:TrpR, YerC/YecD [Thermaerobacter sp. PB12/4term]|uniref:YerC/YecD family TrpR-related protein n=1 Tax=Thermaerobacter sp. PB12/4term TaxID=2293838 RepID=UPI000E328EA2|nr:TrpR, YerC/YecD [Thermaerobacter sp. PB12/4term]
MAYQSRLQHPRVDRLFEAILSLENLEECYRFFEDLCTVGEIQSLALRFEVAQRLARGQTYEQIQRETGMSSATISRINRFLHYGADGYRLVLERLAQRQRGGAEPAGDPRVESAPPPGATAPDRGASSPPDAGGGAGSGAP